MPFLITSGIGKVEVPAEDRLEEAWRHHYASIFNPARPEGANRRGKNERLAGDDSAVVAKKNKRYAVGHWAEPQLPVTAPLER